VESGEGSVESGRAGGEWRGQCRVGQCWWRVQSWHGRWLRAVAVRMEWAVCSCESEYIGGCGDGW